MKMLFIGDIVGPEATEHVSTRLPDLREEHAVDLVVANAENCAVTGPDPAQGFGMTKQLAELLFDSGVDVITGGNHSWDGPEAEEVLEHPRVLRPHNVQEGVVGKGALSLEAAGKEVTVVNLLSKTARPPSRGLYLKHSPLPEPYSPYRAWAGLRLEGAVVVDFHGDSVWEKMSLARALDGKVAAVLGTHTHHPTANTHLLPGGTGFMAEVGMVGRLGGAGAGFDNERFAVAMRGDDPSSLPAFSLEKGRMVFGMVLLEIKDGKTEKLCRVG